jgi:hypothetical protein
LQPTPGRAGGRTGTPACGLVTLLAGMELMLKTPKGLRNLAMVQIWRLVAQYKATLPIVPAVHPMPHACLFEAYFQMDRDRAGRTTLVLEAREWFATGIETSGASVACRAQRLHGLCCAWLRDRDRFAKSICILTLMS